MLTHLPSRLIELNGETYCYFSGTSYLGMGHNEVFREVLLEGMGHYGTSYGSSRRNLLQLSIYEEAEDFIARWTTAPAALTCSSGLLAGQILSRFIESSAENVYFFAPKTHPANWNSQYQASNLSFDEWEMQVPHWVAQSTAQRIVIVANAIDSFACEVQSLDFIQQLPANKAITIIIDDSHGIGVTGTDGNGIWGQINCPPHVRLIVVASMNKALGIPGGMILSDSDTIQALQESPYWIGASPIVPAYLYAFLHAQPAYTQARAVLQRNIAIFTQYSDLDEQFAYLPNYPVFKSKHNNLYDKLIVHRIMPYHFTYPSQSTEAVTRLVISSLHTEGDIFYLADSIKKRG